MNEKHYEPGSDEAILADARRRADESDRWHAILNAEEAERLANRTRWERLRDAALACFEKCHWDALNGWELRHPYLMGGVFLLMLSPIGIGYLIASGTGSFVGLALTTVLLLMWLVLSRN